MWDTTLIQWVQLEPEPTAPTASTQAVRKSRRFWESPSLGRWDQVRIVTVWQSKFKLDHNDLSWWIFDGYHGIAGLQYLSWHRAKMSKALETDGNSWIGLAAVWRHFEPLLVWCVACCFLGVVVCSHDPYVLQLAWRTFFGFRCFSRLCGVAFHCFPNFCRRWLHSGHGLASACALHCTTPSLWPRHLDHRQWQKDWPSDGKQIPVFAGGNYLILYSIQWIFVKILDFKPTGPG